MVIDQIKNGISIVWNTTLYHSEEILFIALVITAVYGSVMNMLFVLGIIGLRVLFEVQTLTFALVGGMGGMGMNEDELTDEELFELSEEIVEEMEEAKARERAEERYREDRVTKAPEDAEWDYE